MQTINDENTLKSFEKWSKNLGRVAGGEESGTELTALISLK